MSNKSSVLIFIEVTEDKTVAPISLECLSTGRKLAAEFGGKLAAVIMGSNTGDAAEELGYYGVDTIFVVENQMLEDYHPDTYSLAFEKVIEEAAPRAIIMGYTLTSIDLAPRMAFRLNAGLITDCVDIEIASGKMLFSKPVYSGNITAVYTLESEPCMVTMRSRAAEPAERSDIAGGELVHIDVEMDPSTIKTPVVKREIEKEEGPKLQSADIVVAGGRGIGGLEGFTRLTDLARLLGGAIGASRPPCDLGWVNSNAQVGQTGEIVGPSVYIAVGISGSTQHIAGMMSSKVIVAINKDANANIFKIADYGVIGKHEEIIPSFMDALREIL